MSILQNTLIVLSMDDVVQHHHALLIA